MLQIPASLLGAGVFFLPILKRTASVSLSRCSPGPFPWHQTMGIRIEYRISHPTRSFACTLKIVITLV